MMMMNIVAHRGLHDVDDSLVRPLENTPHAFFESSKLCSLGECDIVASKDGQIYMCHDKTFARLAKDPSSPLANTDVCLLDAAEIESIVLKDGSTPCNMVEMLEYASELHVRLVVEIKTDLNVDVLLVSLKQLFTSRPRLTEQVDVIMSFDLRVMQDLAKWADKPADVKMMLLLSNQTMPGSDPVALVKDNGLDGVYLQFHESMLDPATQHELAAICQQVPTVGVWNASKAQPEFDGLKTAEQLVALGVQFVNSDLPEEQLVALGLRPNAPFSAKPLRGVFNWLRSWW